MTKKARRFRRALSSREREDCGLCRLFLHYRLFVLSLTLGRLRTSAGTLRNGTLNLLDRFVVCDALHRRDLAGEAIERGLVELELRVRLLRLRVRAKKI